MLRQDAMSTTTGHHGSYDRLGSALALLAACTLAGCCMSGGTPGGLGGGPITGGDCGYQPVPGTAHVTALEPLSTGAMQVRYRFEPDPPAPPSAAVLTGVELSLELPCAACATQLGLAVGGTSPMIPRISSGGGCAPFADFQPWDAADCACAAP